jgi:hypothetical protein
MCFYQRDTFAQVLEVLLLVFDLEAKLSQSIKKNTAVVETVLLYIYLLKFINREPSLSNICPLILYKYIYKVILWQNSWIKLYIFLKITTVVLEELYYTLIKFKFQRNFLA